MTNDELFDLYWTVAEGISTLRRQAEAAATDSSPNHARVLFCSLGGYLLDNGLLDDLATYGHHMSTGGSALLYDDRDVLSGI